MARDLVADQRRLRGATDRYEPDEDALGRAPIPEPIRKELFDDYRGLEVPHLTKPEDASETLCYACLSSGMRTALALNQGGVQHGMLARRRTIMHASHVMAHSELLSNGHQDEETLNHVDNLRPCCASCNFDMGKHNMFDYLEICGWMVGDEKEWRAWKSGL